MDSKINFPEINNNYEILKNRENFIDEKNNIIVEIDTQSYGFISKSYYKDSYFKINKKYYENLNILSKGLIFNNGSQYGIWYEFDEDGKLIKEIDTDEGFDFGWEDIFEYCKKNKIPLVKGKLPRGGLPTEILQLDENGNKIWQLLYYLKGIDKQFQVKLDGKTGELISKIEVNLD